MLKLVLVRHAKSDWGDAGLSDFHRPLAPRGRRAAEWLGRVFEEDGIAPELIVCSPAVRTQQTLQRSGLRGEVRLEPRVYDQRDGDYVDLIREVGGVASPLVFIGHNSATAVTAALLAGGDAMVDFPTAAFAVIDFAISDWSEVAAGQGRLVEYRVPPKD